MNWGNDHHSKTHYGRWGNRLHDAYYGDEDDDDNQGDDGCAGTTETN